MFLDIKENLIKANINKNVYFNDKNLINDIFFYILLENNHQKFVFTFKYY